MATSVDSQAPAAGQNGHLSPDERAEIGKSARSNVGRSAHAEWKPADNRPNPIDLLEQQAATRVPELVPIRYGRMAASPFAFYRGGAYIMASDLSTTPNSGIRVQLCGDAHLSNFGGFASPERDLLFDLNDFDETLPGPWEWDVKRLAASLVIAGRDRGFSTKQRRTIVQSCVAAYREAMRGLATMPELQIWYQRVDENAVAAYFGPQATARQAKQFDKAVTKARAKDSTRAFTKLASTIDGTPRIISDPPLVVPIRELLPEVEAGEFTTRIVSLLDTYKASLPGYLCKLIDRYQFMDIARKVVGVGSVGTRAWIILMIGRDHGDPLFLQAKEARPSVLEPFAGKSEFGNQGRRVVEGQRLMQAAGDVFLGWLRTTGLDGKRRDFYVRQLWDWKTSAEIESMLPSGMQMYGRLCGTILARAHARSGDAIALAAYLGAGDSFDRALVEFAELYADQNEEDHRLLLDAIESGRLEAVAGI
ncbi:MAG TPA: DUF2252 domain-containing protein [Thermoleophilaceae bacterium]|jgi:uncharacterized protein (DUF2252 family)